VAEILKISGLRKQYSGLRPLRVNALSIHSGDRVALQGFDAGAAEVLVNLVTGASLPDEGVVEVCGRATQAISDGDEWLESLDRFGIVSPRAVLLDAATLLQNLAMPLSLEIEPVPPAIVRQVEELAGEVGLDMSGLNRPIAALDAAARARAHLARAVALNPALLILEHPTVGFTAGQATPFGHAVASLAAKRELATLIISEDQEFTSAVASHQFALKAATGELKPKRRSFFGFPV
jgi:ABC-type transporter Mla maintaining outer membrane lipid asymmetry ATPase subunit MlaF